MTIDEAIKLLKDIGPYRGTLSEDDLKAIKLGIEALQFFKGAQKVAGGFEELRLSGETTD